MVGPCGDLTFTSTPSTYTNPPGPWPAVGYQCCKYSQKSINSPISWPEGPLVLLCCGVNRLQVIGFLSGIVCHSNDVLQARAKVKNNKYKDFHGLVV